MWRSATHGLCAPVPAGERHPDIGFVLACTGCVESCPGPWGLPLSFGLCPLCLACCIWGARGRGLPAAWESVNRSQPHPCQPSPNQQVLRGGPGSQGRHLGQRTAPGERSALPHPPWWVDKHEGHEHSCCLADGLLSGAVLSGAVCLQQPHPVEPSWPLTLLEPCRRCARVWVAPRP